MIVEMEPRKKRKASPNFEKQGAAVNGITSKPSAMGLGPGSGPGQGQAVSDRPSEVTSSRGWRVSLVERRRGSGLVRTRAGGVESARGWGGGGEAMASLESTQVVRVPVVPAAGQTGWDDEKEYVLEAREAVTDDGDDDGFEYKEVEVSDLGEDEEDGEGGGGGAFEDGDLLEDEDLAVAMDQLMKTQGGVPSMLTGGLPEPVPEKRVAETADDFVRNFCHGLGMRKTMAAFELEWQELRYRGKLKDVELQNVDDCYTHNRALLEEIAMLRAQVKAVESVNSSTSGTWEKFRRERDFHRMHHKRVLQEKDKLIQDIRRLRDYCTKLEPTIAELKRKYEKLMNEKTLVRLDRDRQASRVKTLEASLGPSAPPPASSVRAKLPEPGTMAAKTLPRKPAAVGAAATNAATATQAGRPLTQLLPAKARVNPAANLDFEPTNAKGLSLSKTFKGHSMCVSNMALHPTRPLLATSSDDCTWKVWTVPTGEMVMCGEGHTDWVSGIAFSPHGDALASGSGDGTVKLWSFEKACCVATLKDHTQPVWDVAYHDLGDVLASCSMDHSVKLWDVAMGRCVGGLRGHVDSVNQIDWAPFSNHIATGSSDKTVSIWDARSGLCVQTFYGHLNSCNHVQFTKKGDLLASSDADGIVKVWDVRMVAELCSFNAGPHAANKVGFDRSGQVLAVASDDGLIKCYNVAEQTLISELKGHEDAVQHVIFDHTEKMLYSCGADASFRIWK